LKDSLEIQQSSSTVSHSKHNSTLFCLSVFADLCCPPKGGWGGVVQDLNYCRI
jgi:hypothetical protein